MTRVSQHLRPSVRRIATLFPEAALRQLATGQPWTGKLPDMSTIEALARAPSGIGGLDDILRGGFPLGRMYLVAGLPGTGKTTLAMQFLLEGIRRGERCLYVTLAETRSEVEYVARSHGWDLSQLHLTELVPSEHKLSADSQLTVFSPSELELGETTEALLEAVEACEPQRVVVDSVSELRYIAQNSLRYRRQILALKRYFSERGCTVLMLDDRSGGEQGDHLQTLAHGVIVLEQLANQFGAERRRLRISKLRGVAFRGGFHDFTIREGGLDVHPRLVAAEHPPELIERDLPSGNRELDGLLGGGLPARANRRWPRCSRRLRPRAASAPRCSFSTRTSARSARAHASSACRWTRP